MAKQQADPACKFDAGAMLPVIDPKRCEAKGPCVEVCPYDVLELLEVPKSELAELGWLTRLKIRVHGGQQAYAVNASACQGCGLCVSACPEKAIRLTRAGS